MLFVLHVDVSKNDQIFTEGKRSLNSYYIRFEIVKYWIYIWKYGLLEKNSEHFQAIDVNAIESKIKGFRFHGIRNKIDRQWHDVTRR